MKKAITSKAISIFLAVLMAVTGILPATAAFAGDGVDGKYDYSCSTTARTRQSQRQMRTAVNIRSICTRAMNFSSNTKL